MTYSFLLLLENGEPGDPTVFVTDRTTWSVDEKFAARDVSQWRIVSFDAAPPLLAAEGFEAIWIVEPLD